MHHEDLRDLFLAFPRLDITGRRFHEDNHIIHSPALRLQAEFTPLHDVVVSKLQAAQKVAKFDPWRQERF